MRRASVIVSTVTISLAAVTMSAPAPIVAPSPVNQPNAFAWQLFIELNHPVMANSRGMPDPDKKIGDDGAVVWETWKRVEEVFLPQGRKPPGWDESQLQPLGLVVPGQIQLRPARKIELDEPAAKAHLLADAEPPDEFGDSAMNRAAFEFVVANELYNVEGQEKFHAEAKIINLPPQAREIKSAWKLLDHKPIDELSKEQAAVYKSRFHTRPVPIGGKTFLYGLTALHTTTKDIPNWFWATFEHEDNPEPELPDNDRAGRPKSLDGTKWSHYRLRGTQVDTVDSNGQATILANTQIEQGFQQSSSCMTCHARATIGDPPPMITGQVRRANRLPFFEIRRLLNRLDGERTSDQLIRYGDTGAIRPALFIENETRRKFTQLDFMWSLRNAQRKGP